ncbi:MAG: PAS domain-containing protein [Halarcobacter sp.]
MSLWVLNQYKKSEIEFYLKNDLNLIEKTYSTYILRSENFSEIIFYNHILENNKIIATLKENISDEKKAKKLYLNIKDSLNNFKKYDLKEVNIYLPSLKPLLKSEYKGYKNSEKNKNVGLIKKSLESLKTVSTFEISSTSASYKYVRPLFDKQLNLLAIVEISTNMPKLSFLISKNTNFETFFIFKKNILKQRLDKKFLKNFKDCILDDNYMYEDSIYNKSTLKELPKEKIQIIKENINRNKKFAINYQAENIYSMISFFPLKNKVSNKKIGYMVALGDNENYSSILKKYDFYFFIIIFLSIIFVVMIFLIHYFYRRFKIDNSKFNSLYKSIDKYVIVAETDTNGLVTHVSESFCKISGYKKDEIIGRPISMLRNPDISKKFFSNMWKIITKGDIWEGEIKNIDKNGNSYWVRGNITPIFNENKNIIGYRSIRVDISDEKQLQKVNELLKRDLFLKLNEIKTRDNLKLDESKIKLMGKLLDAFSNEWKKPISNISLNLMDIEDKLKNKNLINEEEIEVFAKINDEVNRLSRQLNDFKSLFSNENAHDRYNVYEVINSVVSSLSDSSIKIDISGNKDLETYGVSFDLRKVVFALINNSMEQFKLKNINNPVINIYISKVGNDILIKCQDNALGIPEKFIKKIFDLDFSTKENISRNGITLHMAKLLIKKSDGDMWVENEENGCSFYIKLITKDRRKIDRL